MEVGADERGKDCELWLKNRLVALSRGAVAEVALTNYARMGWARRDPWAADGRREGALDAAGWLMDGWPGAR